MNCLITKTIDLATEKQQLIDLIANNPMTQYLEINGVRYRLETELVKR